MKIKPYLYALGAVLCWASLPAATGSGLNGLTTEELMFYSFLSASVYLYLQNILITKSYKLYYPGMKVILLGIWGIFIYHFVYYKALDNAPLAEGAILATTWSFWIVVFSSILQYKKIKISIIITALIGLFGASLVISSGKELTFDTSYILGYSLALLCVLIWSSFSVILSLMKTKEDPMVIFTISAAILSTILFIITMPHKIPSTENLISAVYLGFIPLGLSFYLWNKAVTTGNVSIIGFISYLTPPLAIILVAIIHKELISFQVIAGMLIIIFAAVIGKFLLKNN
jgi:drug/metabolite transporter (DMT)-like permease